MMQLTVKDAGAFAVLTLQGELHAGHAGELKDCLRRLLGYVGRLIVNCEKVTGVDAACLRILCSAYRVSQNLQKEFSVAGHSPELFREAVKTS